MNKFLASLVITVGLTTGAMAETGCSDTTSFNKLLNDGGFEVLLRGNAPDGKVNEIWINGKASVLYVAYDKPKDDKPESIKQVCVTGVANKVVYNGDTIELLNKALEKLAPKS